MNWDAIGAIGEIVGAFAVVVSLLYLAIQLRNQNRETRIAAIRGVVTAQRLSMRIFLEPGIAEDFLTVLANFGTASPAQRLRFTMILMDIWKQSQEAFLQYLDHRLESDIWDGIYTQLADLMTNPSCLAVWSARQHQFDNRFRKMLDEIEPGKQLYDTV